MNEVNSNDELNESSPEETSSVVLPWGISSAQVQKRSVEQVVGQVQISSTNSPLPPPEVLEKYQAIGYGDEIVNLIRREQEHRQKLEVEQNQHSQQMDKKLVENYIESTKSEHNYKKRGQIFALIVTLTAIISGSLVAVNGSRWAGGIIGTGGVIGLASTFIKGRDQKSKKSEEFTESNELIEKQKNSE